MLEKQCDVHISDYICFSAYHSKAFVIKEYAIRILKYIGINNRSFKNEEYIEQWLNRYPYNHMCEIV